MFWLDFVQSPVKLAVSVTKLNSVVDHFFEHPVKKLPYKLSACVATGQYPDAVRGHIEADRKPKLILS